MSVRVMSWAFAQADVESPTELVVLLALADHAHDDGTGAWPSVETLSEKCRLSRRGVQKVLRRLEDRFVIVATGRSPRGTIVYQILMDWGERRSLLTAVDEYLGGRTSEHDRGEPGSPETSVEPSTWFFVEEPTTLTVDQQRVVGDEIFTSRVDLDRRAA